MRQWCGVTCTPATRALMRSAATSALDLPTSPILRGGRVAGVTAPCRGVAPPARALRAADGAHLKRNWRLRLDTSMVSMSMTSMCTKPVSARSLRISQPRPPAPTHRMRHASDRMNSRSSGPTSKPGPVRLPWRSSRLSRSRQRPATSMLALVCLLQTCWTARAGPIAPQGACACAWGARSWGSGSSGVQEQRGFCASAPFFFSSGAC